MATADITEYAKDELANDHAQTEATLDHITGDGGHLAILVIEVSQDRNNCLLLVPLFKR